MRIHPVQHVSLCHGSPGWPQSTAERADAKACYWEHSRRSGSESPITVQGDGDAGPAWWRKRGGGLRCPVTVHDDEDAGPAWWRKRGVRKPRCAARFGGTGDVYKGRRAHLKLPLGALHATSWSISR